MEVEGVEGECITPRDPYYLPEADSSVVPMDERLEILRLIGRAYPGRVENESKTPPDPDPSPMADLSDDSDEPADYVGFLEHIEAFRSPTPPVPATVPKVRVPKLDLQRMDSAPLIRGDHFKTASVRLANITKGCSTGSVIVEFSSENIIPSKGLIRVSFPPGFGLSCAYLKEAIGIHGDLKLSVQDEQKNTLTLTRHNDHGLPTKPGQSIELVFYNIINPWDVGPIGFFSIATFASRDDPFPISQRMFVSRVCIVERASPYNNSVLSQTPSPSSPGPEPFTRKIQKNVPPEDVQKMSETIHNQKNNQCVKEPCGDDTPYMARNFVRDFVLRLKACTQKYCRMCI